MPNNRYLVIDDTAFRNTTYVVAFDKEDVPSEYEREHYGSTTVYDSVVFRDTMSMIILDDEITVKFTNKKPRRFSHHTWVQWPTFEPINN